MKDTNIIKENRDFRRAYAKGKYCASPCVVTYIIKNRLNKVRYGITTGKKIGNAPQRNRARRVIRAAYSVLKNDIKSGIDIIFVARNNSHEVKMQEIFKQMKYQLRKLGVLK